MVAVDVQAVTGLALGASALLVVGLLGINSLDDTRDIGVIGSVGILDSAKDHSLVSNVHCMDCKTKRTGDIDDERSRRAPHRTRNISPPACPS